MASADWKTTDAKKNKVEDLKTHYETFKKELLKLDTHNISSVNG